MSLEPQDLSQVAAPKFMPSQFTVHVFISHDPSAAVGLLPDLFRDFPDSAWRLPQEIPTPPRPEIIPEEIPPEIIEELMAHPRDGLGRYVFLEPLSSSITTSQLSSLLEQEFNIKRNIQAHFIIFPQLSSSYSSYWNGRPLPWDVTLAEAAMMDEDALEDAQYLETSEDYAPVLHLVIETKAAALSRIVRADFLRGVFPLMSKPDMWNQLESFQHAFMRSDTRVFSSQGLREWRSSFWSLRYLEGDRARIVEKRYKNESELQDLDAKIAEARKTEEKAKAYIEKLVSSWEEWVLNQNYSFDSETNFEELKEDEIEDKVRAVLRQRHVLTMWGKSDRKNDLREMLRNDYFNCTLNSYSNTNSKQEGDNPNPESANELEDDASWVMIEKESKLQQNLFPTRLSPVRADALRDEKGIASTFTISSGVLSWGQLLPIYYSTTQSELTNNALRGPEELPGGTIRQHVYTYKSAARIGKWRVWRLWSGIHATYSLDLDFEIAEKEEGLQTGWVICHEDINPIDIVRRVRSIDSTGPGAVSNGNGHVDKDVRYIGRYDWAHAWHHPDDEEFEDKFYDYLGIENPKNVPQAPLSKEERTALEKLNQIHNYIRLNFQRTLLGEAPPSQQDMIYVSRALKYLEDNELGLDVGIIRMTKIHKVLRRIGQLDPDWFPDGDGEDGLRTDVQVRARVLLEKWMERMAAEPAGRYGAIQDLENVGEKRKWELQKAGYFIAIDSQEVSPEFITAVLQDPYYDASRHLGRSGGERVMETVFGKLIEADEGGDFDGDGNRNEKEKQKDKRERNFGVSVGFADTEYEFGWLVFDGKAKVKGKDNGNDGGGETEDQESGDWKEEEENDELVAIIYDGTYEVLEGLWHKVETEAGIVVV